MLLLAFLYRIGLALHPLFPFVSPADFAEYFVLFLNTLNVCAALAAVAYLLRILLKKSMAATWCALILLVSETPVWFYTRAFYTDSLSFCFSITAAAFFLKGVSFFTDPEQEKTVRKKVRGMCALGASALLWGLGWLWKPTACISLVAAALALLLCGLPGKAVRKGLGKPFLLFVCVLFLLPTAFSWIRKDLPSETSPLREAYRVPVTFWIALGLRKDGSWTENSSFHSSVFAISDPRERAAFVNRYISEHRSDFLEPSHLKAKLLRNFASGDLNWVREARLTRSPYAAYMDYMHYDTARWLWPYNILSLGHWLFLLFLILSSAAGSALTWLLPGKGNKDLSLAPLTAHLTLFGLFLFLMVWESNPRQLYNHIPWLCFCASLGLEQLSGFSAVRTLRLLSGRKIPRS
ncbi:MAG: hypothetical protein LBQ15_05165 [Clostridium sp.]|jgi:hypothetical protein|nr:hypothetical protein [Clostridium sp.]